MWDVIICFELRSSERIAEAKTVSISISLAILTGNEGPEFFRNSIMPFFFCGISIIVLRKDLEL